MCRNFSYKLQQSGNISHKILQTFSIKLYTCRNHASYTSVKFLPALHLKIMISYLAWNMLIATSNEWLCCFLVCCFQCVCTFHSWTGNSILSTQILIKSSFNEGSGSHFASSLDLSKSLHSFVNDESMYSMAIASSFILEDYLQFRNVHGFYFWGSSAMIDCVLYHVSLHSEKYCLQCKPA